MKSNAPLLICSAALGLAAVVSLTGQEAAPGTATPGSVKVFQNVRIFDGKSATLSAPSNVLVRGNLIETISTSPIPTDRRADTVIIEGGGKTLMPGLIDAHVHTMMESISLSAGLSSDISYVTLVAARAAERQLLRGFTTVRDLGGASMSLKAAIDQGLHHGPRIYPSGATISQTGGHGDFRMPNEVPEDSLAPLSYMEKTGMTMIADGADEVLKRVREQLRNGATQIKLMAGGGVASSYDPLDVTQYTSAEFAAAVSAAENWGTYVTVHAYKPKAIRSAVEAGVKCLEHGQLIDEDTAKFIADKGVWWSLQPFMDDPDAPSAFPEGSPNRLKQKEMFAGTDTAYQLARKYKIKTAFGTDNLFSAANASTQGKQLVRLKKWYTPAEALIMATSTNAELLAQSGPRNPYPGKLGVVEEGAYADLLLVDGNPLENLDLVADPGKNFTVIMKDGVIYKDSRK
ncbi:MAG: amidohydrolase family protein [Verrucomicrobiota bacterium]